MPKSEEKEEKKKKRRAKGEGTVYKRKNGLYAGQALIGYDPVTGKPKRKTVYGKTKPEVVQKLRKILVLAAEGNLTDTSETVEQWLDIWMNDFMINKLRPTTYESYNSFIRLHINPYIGKMKLKNLTTHHIQKLYNHASREGRCDGKGGLAPRSVERIHTILHSSLEQAVALRKIPHNPAGAAVLPVREQKDIRPLTREEQDRFERELDNFRLGTAFFVCLYGGLRRGEVLGLKWSDIDFEKKTIRVQRAVLRVKDKFTGKSELRIEDVKTKKSRRIVPVPDIVIARLKEHKARQAAEILRAGPMYQKNDLVFCTTLGTPIEPRNFNRDFYQICKNAGIENFNLHGLRHTYTTRLSEMGINSKILQELLGHTDVRTTEGYNHVLWDMMVLAADRLNDYILERKKNPSGTEG